MVWAMCSEGEQRVVPSSGLLRYLDLTDRFGEVARNWVPGEPEAPASESFNTGQTTTHRLLIMSLAARSPRTGGQWGGDRSGGSTTSPRAPVSDE